MLQCGPFGEPLKGPLIQDSKLPVSEPAPKIVWLLTDNKPGHLNQLRGLAACLQRRAGVRCEFLVVGRRPTLWQCWRGADMFGATTRPDLILAAGSGTQAALLASKRHFGCPAVLLMKPNFPYSWLDGAIVPAHDRPPIRPDVLVTEGVLNAVTPIARPVSAKHGLILIGGPSKHFGWDNPRLAGQVKQLAMETPDWRWTLSDSRRTPPDFLASLAGLPNLICLSHTDTGPDWLPQAMADSARIWVSPDSVSMVYEALTAGVPTGVLDLPDPGSGRVVRGLRALIDSGRLVSFDQRQRIGAEQCQPLWEADRAARWLLDRFRHLSGQN